MSWTHAAKGIAERFGVQIATTRRRGIDHYVDMNGIKPLRSYATIADVGAHRGETALALAERMPKAQIYSFEPMAENYRAMVSNVAENTRITCVHSALGPEDAEAVLEYGATSQQHSIATHSPDAKPDASEVVKVTSLDGFAEAQDIGRFDLVKTDTEGYDLEVLAGASRMLREGRIDFVYSETAFDASDRQHTSFTDLLGVMRGYDYRFIGLYELRHEPNPWRLLYCNALFTRL